MSGPAGYGHVSGAVEGLPLPFGGWLIGAPEGHEQLAIEGKFLDGMEPVIHEVDRLIRADVDAMRPITELSLAEGAQEIAVPIEHAYRMLAAVKDVYIVAGVHGHARNIDKFPPRG